MNKYLLKKAYIVLSYVLLAVFLLRNLLFAGGYPGFSYDWSYVLFRDASDYQQTLSIWTTAANGQLNQYNTGFLIVAINWVGHMLFPSPTSATVAILALWIVVAGLGMYALLRAFRFTSGTAWLIGMAYASSFVLLSRLSAGYTWYVASVAWLPVLLLAYTNLVKRWSMTTAAAVIVTAALALAQVQFFPLFLLIVGCELVVACTLGQSPVSRIRAIATVIGGWVIVNGFWLYSLLIVKGLPQVTGLQSMALPSRIEGLARSFWNTLFLGEFANTQEIILSINSQPLRAWALATVLAITLTLASYNKQRKQLVIACLTGIGVVIPLAIGSNPPFAGVLSRLIEIVPPLAIFREVPHLQIILLVAYCGIGAVAIEQFLQLRFAFFSAKSLKIVQIAVISAAIITINLPALSGDLYRTLGTVSLPDDLDRTEQALAKAGSSRIFYPPSLGFWRVTEDDRRGINYPDQFALSNRRPSVTQASSDLDSQNASWRLRNVASSQFVRGNQSLYATTRLLGADTIVGRDWLHSRYYEAVGLDRQPVAIQRPWSIERFQDQVQRFPELVAGATDLGSGVHSYVVPGNGELVKTVSSVSLLCDLSSITEATQAFITDTRSPLAPYAVDQCSEPDKRIQQGVVARFDYANLVHSPSLGWSPGQFSFWRSDLFATTLGPLLYTSVPSTVQAQLEKKGGIVRYFVSPYGGSLSINGTTITTVSEQEGWREYAVPESEGKVVTVQSVSGEQALAWIGSPSVELTPSTPVKALAEATVVWNRPSPTHFAGTVTSEDSSNETLLVIAENYHPGWRLAIKDAVLEPVHVNDYAMGFLIPAGKSGSFTVDFTPQRPYMRLVVLSFGCLSLAAAYLLYDRFKRR